MTTGSQVTAGVSAAKPQRLAFVLSTFSLLAFMLTFDMLMVTAVLPAMSADLAIAQSQLGWVAGSHALTFCLAALVMGPLSDRFGRRAMLLTGLLIFIAGNFLCSGASSFTMLLVYRMIAGIGSAMVMPNIWSSVGHLFPMEKMGRAMGVIWSAVSLATIVGIPSGTYLVGGSWRLLFQATAWISLLMAALVALVPVGKQPGVQVSYLKPFGIILRHGGAMRALGSTFFWNLSLFGTYALIGVFYHDLYRFDTQQVGLVILAGGIGNFSGSTLSGKWGDKFNKRTIIRVTALLAAATVFPFTQGFGWVASLALQVLWSAAVGFGAGSLTTTVVMQKPEVRGTVMSLNSSFMNGSIVLGGVLSGYLVHTSDGSYSAVGAMSAIAALLVFALIPAIPKPSGK